MGILLGADATPQQVDTSGAVSSRACLSVRSRRCCSRLPALRRSARITRMSSSHMPSAGFCPRSSTWTKASDRRSRRNHRGPSPFTPSSWISTAAARRAYEEKLLELLRLKYAGVKLDLIVSGTSRALRFLLAHRDDLFPGVPIVFTTVEKKTGVDFVLPADVTGVWVEIDWRGTLEAALQLQPQTRRVVVVGERRTSTASGYGAPVRRSRPTRAASSSPI